MDEAILDDALARLQAAGAVAVYLHGSQANHTATKLSDIELAALFPDPAPLSFELDLPPEVDLLVLNGAPLEIAGRIACGGTLVLEVDPLQRVHWEATTRKIYLDEKYRIERSHREFLEAVTRG
jgi:predicted nucleotidyltransferase